MLSGDSVFDETELDDNCSEDVSHLNEGDNSSSELLGDPDLSSAQGEKTNFLQQTLNLTEVMEKSSDDGDLLLNNS